MLVNVTAELECDKCGKHQTFDIDAAYVVPTGWSVFDLAQDVTRWTGSGFADKEGGWICQKCDQDNEAAKAEGGGE